MNNFFRIIKFSVQDISRNIWLSVATITILVLTLFSINMMATVRVISDNAISVIKGKVDFSLYLKSEAREDEIMALKDRIGELGNVKSVDYISKQQALQKFRDKNQNNQQVIEALRELGKNPLSPSLTISPKDTAQAPQLVESLKRLDSDIIESRDFADNASIIKKIDYITNKINEAGIFVIIVFSLTSLLVIYNTVKVTIYTHRREIEIMIYSLIATLIITSIFFPFLSLLQPYLEVFFTGYNINIVSYFITNFLVIFGAEFLAAAFASSLASLLAVRKYSKV
ncbi:MAG: permease-like cell division protein FtsX [Candidatus Falkowbacteria bacterium]|nr:permease-like cell division protein FtsX [Candidatus Falkowbacteria bacterium]